MHDVHDPIDILVSRGRLFGQAGHAAGAHPDAAGFEVSAQGRSLHRAFGLVPAHGAARAMAGGSECLGHAALGSDQHPAGSAHRARYQHRLPDVPVDRRQHLRSGSEGPRGAFAMHAHVDHPFSHRVGFQLGHVVRDIVNLEEMMVFQFPGQHLFERTSDMVGQHLAVGKCIIGGGLHGGVVVSAFRAAQWRTDQLAIGQIDAVFAHGFLEEIDIVGADLMPEAPRSAMDLDHHLPDEDTDSPGDHFVRDPIDHVHLDEVVAGPQRADLALATVARTHADFFRIRAGQTAFFLRALQVGGASKPALDGPPSAFFHDLIQFAGSKLHRAALADTAGAVGVQHRCQIIQVRPDGFNVNLAGQQTDPAVDVVAHAARRYHSVRQGRGHHAADGKPVALVHVRHGQDLVDNARQRGGVDQLFQAAVAEDVFDQGLVGIKPGRHAHVRPKRRRDFIEVGVDFAQIAHAHHGGLLSAEERWVTRRTPRSPPDLPDGGRWPDCER